MCAFDMAASLKSLLLLAASCVARSTSNIAVRDSVTATVDLSSSNGSPQHLASGFIYGIPDNYPNQIPDSWFVYPNVDMVYLQPRY